VLTVCLVVKEIENLDTLTALEELWLGKNKITQLKVAFHSSGSQSMKVTDASQRTSPIFKI
jgi:hypothetical protein